MGTYIISALLVIALGYALYKCFSKGAKCCGDCKECGGCGSNPEHKERPRH